MNNKQITEKPNYWKLLLHFLNDFEVGTKISRQQILDQFSIINPAIVTLSTDVIDKYRRWLSAANFLKDTKVKGIYKINKKIDINLSSSECERLGYPERFKKLDKEKARKLKLKNKNSKK